MNAPARRRATYQDVLDSPPHQLAELIDGALYTHPRPAMAHANASSILGAELVLPFRQGKGGPGGWIILDEPELHLGAEPDILVPDLAGWRRETLPELPDSAFLTIAPDWLAEISSPSTLRFDRVQKLPIYQREQVRHVWLIDPAAQLLEVLRLDGASYRLVATHGGDAKVRAEPFDAIELELAALWAR
ncbi:MAG TPA: Uma2 family endonuclease [Polyangiaceae bacterium]|jgi:Uma2 family endonuclease|nr:Uma2 family endonuclease [Polyangiaceae bacterium]